MALDIFRIADGTEMTPNLLAKYISKNDAIVTKRYKPLWDAYNNDYAIFHAPKKESWKPDHRVCCNFAQYIVDTFEGFFLGCPIDLDAKDDVTRAYVNYLQSYNDLDDQNAELSKIVSIFGRGYEIYYTDENAEICSYYLDPMESFIIYDEGINPEPRYFVRVYVDSNNVKRGSISDAYTVQYFKYASSLKWDGEPDEHNFNGVPATEYIMNRQRRGIFENVLPLIDTFNHTLSAKANDVDSFSDSYLFIKGAKLDEVGVKHIRDNRIINFSGDGVLAEFLQKPSGDDTQEHLLDRAEKLIFAIAMVCNISDDASFGTSSGIAIKYRLSPMGNLAKSKERKFKSSLQRRYRLMFSNPVSGMARDAWVGINYTFTQNIPIDTVDEATTANALTGITSKRTQLRLISEVSDVDAELEQIKRERDETAYDTDYPTNRTVNQVGD